MTHTNFDRRNRFFWAMAIFLAFTAIIATSNHVASLSGGDEESTEMMISGMLFGFLGIPVFSVALPLWLAHRWDLPRSWLPQKGNWIFSVAILGLYLIIGNFVGFQLLLKSDFDIIRFMIHFISSMLFHVPYYPLFAILIFTTARAWRGTWFAVSLTALLFSLYHLAHFYFFPAGTTPVFLVGLFAAFAIDLLLYLLTRSLFLIAFVHSISGAVNMAAQGTYHDGVDFIFYLTIVIVSAIIIYGVLDHRNLLRRGKKYAEFWPEIK